MFKSLYSLFKRNLLHKSIDISYARSKSFYTRRMCLESLESRELLNTYTWMGRSSNLWNTATNWDPMNVPPPGSDLIFDGNNTSTKNNIYNANVLDYRAKNDL
jgi:hypothetical protein